MDVSRTLNRRQSHFRWKNGKSHLFRGLGTPCYRRWQDLPVLQPKAAGPEFAEDIRCDRLRQWCKDAAAAACHLSEPLITADTAQSPAAGATISKRACSVSPTSPACGCRVGDKFQIVGDKFQIASRPGQILAAPADDVGVVEIAGTM
jgi:hypothetical protein